MSYHDETRENSEALGRESMHVCNNAPSQSCQKLALSCHRQKKEPREQAPNTHLSPSIHAACLSVMGLGTGRDSPEVGDHESETTPVWSFYRGNSPPSGSLDLNRFLSFPVITRRNSKHLMKPPREVVAVVKADFVRSRCHSFITPPQQRGSAG